MRCDKCGAYASRGASYCRNCGAGLQNLRLPVKRAPAHPTVWKQTAPVLARGVALVALGVAAEVVINALAKGALRLPALGRSAKTKPLPARRDERRPKGIYAVSETVVMRRVILRR